MHICIYVYVYKWPSEIIIEMNEGNAEDEGEEEEGEREMDKCSGRCVEV